MTLPAQEGDKGSARRSTTPTVIRHLPARAQAQAPKSAPKRAQPAPPSPVPDQPSRTATPMPATATPRPRVARGYATGFAASMLATAALLALYLATPMLAEMGLPLADQLSGLRSEVDQARLWLSAMLTPR